MTINDNQWTNMIYFAIEKGDEDCRNHSLDAPEQVLCQWCCNIYKLKKKNFLHILTDSNLSSFCTYFHSRQTTQFSSLVLYFDRVIPLIRPPMISRWNVSSPRVLFVCVLDWRSTLLNHNMKWSASCRSNIEYLESLAFAVLCLTDLYPRKSFITKKKRFWITWENTCSSPWELHQCHRWWTAFSCSTWTCSAARQFLVRSQGLGQTDHRSQVVFWSD